MLQKAQAPAVSVVREVAFGPLTLTFTDTFQLRWNDQGSGADHDGAFYHPNAPAGFSPLGGLGVSGYNNPDHQTWALCVKATVENSGAVARPTGYSWIWGDGGSGADRDGSCWRPNPPAGYVALGDVFVSNYDPPAVEDVWCVRADLVWDGIIADWIWDDSGSGADADFSAWTINPMAVYISDTKILIAPNTYYGHASHDRPNVAVKVLCLEPPTESGAQPPLPRLDSFAKPPEQSELVRDRCVTVPFTGVTDDQYGVDWKVANSPFYVLERWVNFQLELYDNNQQAQPHTIESEVTVGVTETSSETFSHEVGISISYETGVSFGVGAKVKGTLSYKFGYSSSTSVAAFRQKTIKMQLVTPGQHAAALWAPRTQFQLVRADMSKVADPLVLEDNAVAFYEREYPAPPGTKPRRRLIR